MDDFTVDPRSIEINPWFWCVVPQTSSQHLSPTTNYSSRWVEGDILIGRRGQPVSFHASWRLGSKVCHWVLFARWVRYAPISQGRGKNREVWYHTLLGCLTAQNPILRHSRKESLETWVWGPFSPGLLLPNQKLREFDHRDDRTRRVLYILVPVPIPVLILNPESCEPKESSLEPSHLVIETSLSYRTTNPKFDRIQ